MNRISGPLLDRIDIRCEIEPVEFDELALKQQGESSSAPRMGVDRVEKCRKELCIWIEKCNFGGVKRIEKCKNLTITVGKCYIGK